MSYKLVWKAIEGFLKAEECKECDAPPNAVALIGAISILFFAYLNCRSKSLVNKMQLVFGLGKALALILVVICGIYGISTGGSVNFKEPFIGTSNGSSVLNGFYGCIFTYAGWNYLNFVIEELKEPERNLPKAASIAIGMIATLYILVNVAYFALLTKDEILSSDAIAVDALRKVWKPLGFVISLLVSLSVFGFINSMLFTTSRVVYSAARKHHMPAFLSYLHCNNETPILSVVAVTLISILLMCVAEITQLEFIIAFCESVFLVLTFLGFLYLRVKRKDIHRPFKAFLPVVIIFGLSMMMIVVVGLTNEHKYSLISLAILLVASIAFIILPKIRYPDKQVSIARKMMNGIQILTNCAAPSSS